MLNIQISSKKSYFLNLLLQNNFFSCLNKTQQLSRDQIRLIFFSNSETIMSVPHGFFQKMQQNRISQGKIGFMQFS